MNVCYIRQYALFNTKSGEMIGHPYWEPRSKAEITAEYGSDVKETEFLVPYHYGIDMGNGGGETTVSPLLGNPIDPAMLKDVLEDLDTHKESVKGGVTHMVNVPLKVHKIKLDNKGTDHNG